MFTPCTKQHQTLDSIPLAMAAQVVAALTPWAISHSNCEPNESVPNNMVIGLPARPCAQAAFQTSFKRASL